MKVNNISFIFSEARTYISNPDKFDKLAQNFDLENSKDAFRISIWFQFLLINRPKTCCIFSASVYALFIANEKNDLFKNQTEYELEISLSFYQKIINASFFITVEDVDDAYYLLSISLILGKYPGMQINSSYKSINELIHGVSNLTLKNLFKHLFVKNEISAVFLNNLPYLTSLEIELMMYALQGNNIRNYNFLNLPISKKESYLFNFKMPKHVLYKDSIVEKGIAISKLLLINDNPTFAYSFTIHCNNFKHNIKKFIIDIEFWKKIYFLLSKIDWGGPVFSLSEYLDFIEFKLDHLKNPRIIKSLNENVLTKEVNIWHNTFLNPFESDDTISLQWYGMKIKKHLINDGDAQYSFQELTSGTDLFKESANLKHCVFTYVNKCFRGECTIVSMKKKYKHEYHSYLTIEIQNGEIIQVGGLKNLKPNSYEISIIKKWAEVASLNW